MLLQPLYLVVGRSTFPPVTWALSQSLGATAKGGRLNSTRMIMKSWESSSLGGSNNTSCWRTWPKWWRNKSLTCKKYAMSPALSTSSQVLCCSILTKHSPMPTMNVVFSSPLPGVVLALTKTQTEWFSMSGWVKKEPRCQPNWRKMKLYSITI